MILPRDQKRGPSIISLTSLFVFDLGVGLCRDLVLSSRLDCVVNDVILSLRLGLVLNVAAVFNVF